MVSTSVTALRAVNQSPPIVAELRALFANIDDEPLVTALVGPTRRGPKGHSVRTLWHCFVAKYHMGLPSTRAMIRTLVNNPFVAEACGFDSAEAIPHEATFSRFFTRLAKPKLLPLVKDVSRRLVRRHYAELPGFGQRVALDSTTLKAWSNGGKTPKADPDAGWSVKNGTQGVKEYTYGWKLHLLVDCEYDGLPIAANVSAGNVHDSKRASNVLREARREAPHFHPRFLMADKGYASRAMFHLVRRQYNADPVIDIPSGSKRLLAQEGFQTSLPGYKALNPHFPDQPRGCVVIR